MEFNLADPSLVGELLESLAAVFSNIDVAIGPQEKDLFLEEGVLEDVVDQSGGPLTSKKGLVYLYRGRRRANKRYLPRNLAKPLGEI